MATAPIKAALDSSLAFLVKSFEPFSLSDSTPSRRPAQTRRSAGVPAMSDSYLFAEQVIPRKARPCNAEGFTT